jgi:hypothetical protein
MFNNCLTNNSSIILDINNLGNNYQIFMDYMFNNCKKLNFIDLSKINIKNDNGYINMDYMFKDCSDLYSVNLFNMNKSSDISARDIFSGCENVKFINLSNFDILYTNLNEANFISIFDNIPENIVYCINEKSKLYSLLSKKNGSVLNCTYDWYKSQKK